MITVTLKDGFMVGEEQVVELQLRKLTASDLIDAEAASEELHIANGQPVLVSSSLKNGIEIIRRSVASYAGYSGPLPEKLLRALTQEDYNALNKQVLLLQSATVDAGTSELGR